MTDKPKSMRNAGATASISRESIAGEDVAQAIEGSFKRIG